MLNISNKAGRITGVTAAYFSKIGTDIIATLGSEQLYSSTKIAILTYVTVGVFGYITGYCFDIIMNRNEERKHE